VETTFENSKYKITWFPKGEIVEFYMKDLEIEKDDVVEMHVQTLRLTKGQVYASIFSAQDFFSISAEARSEGSKPYYSENLIAQAFVVKNMAQRLLGNFIMKFNRPVKETKMFGTHAEARLWVNAKIKQYHILKNKEAAA
jgi:hypothetical protein